jgi:hypothetical protein
MSEAMPKPPSAPGFVAIWLVIHELSICLVAVVRGDLRPP